VQAHLSNGLLGRKYFCELVKHQKLYIPNVERKGACVCMLLLVCVFVCVWHSVVYVV